MNMKTALQLSYLNAASTSLINNDQKRSATHEFCTNCTSFIRTKIDHIIVLQQNDDFRLLKVEILETKSHKTVLFPSNCIKLTFQLIPRYFEP